MAKKELYGEAGNHQRLTDPRMPPWPQAAMETEMLFDDEVKQQLAAKDAVIAELVRALKGIESLFSEEPKMYLRPVDHAYRMTHGDSDRVDDAFDKVRAALAAAALSESEACTHTSAYYKEEKPCMICGEKP
jgi:hypothetical protein